MTDDLSVTQYSCPLPIARGFTLIEMAVALFVISLLLGSILVPLAAQVEQRQISETQKTMGDVRDALVGFAVTNGYLPCPDAMPPPSPVGTTLAAEINNGAEDVDAAGDCQTKFGTISIGNLPWTTLGLANKDAWGNRFRYIVVTDFARLNPVFAITTTLPAFRLCEDAACTSVTSSTAVAMVISHGNNGFSAMNATTNALNPSPPLSAIDERKNADTTLDKVSRTKSTIVGNEFDDIVITLSRFTLINRMVAVGKLP